MKWTVLLFFVVIWTGCAATPKRKPIHHHHATQKHPKVTAVGDDAAIKAIIKSLRE